MKLSVSISGRKKFGTSFAFEMLHRVSSWKRKRKLNFHSLCKMSFLSLANSELVELSVKSVTFGSKLNCAMSVDGEPESFRSA